MLTPVIKVDSEKCINCHACITACPVKYCLDGSGDVISVNHDLCIGCGSCIKACTHGARGWLDDSEAFFSGLRRKEKMVVIAAPAVVSSFPSTYLHLNGYLKSLGVEAVFDVSFGAELTVKSYLAHLEDHKPKLVIAQPCPAIVTYIETYRPELLPYLAPADSPMLHTIKMIKEYYPEYRNHKFAALSPCLAKRREFDEAGLGDYNVTLRSIKAVLERDGVDLETFQAEAFGNPAPERAVLFPIPGGLLETAEREAPGIREKTRKIEGPQAIYPYLDKLQESLSRGTNPLLVDCLNCELGCNGGPGTDGAEESPDILEHSVKVRRRQLRERLVKRYAFLPLWRFRRLLSRYWKKDLYRRTYRDLSKNYTLKLPSAAEAKSIHERMKKFREQDFYNCTSCGYSSCEAMTIAIFNGLNKPENCHHFLVESMHEEKRSLQAFNQALNAQIADVRSLIKQMTELIEDLDGKTQSQSSALEQSSAAVEEVLASINSASQASLRKRESIEGLLNGMRRGREAMGDTISAIDDISKSVNAIAETIEIIDDVAMNTNILSMNAAIEAAHAGEAGKGFAVVAAEIRRLSETTQENSGHITDTLNRIIEGIASTARRSADTGVLIQGVGGEIGGVADNMTELINTMSEMAAGSGQITQALADLGSISTDVKTSYEEMTDMVRRLNRAMDAIAEESRKNLETVGA